MHVKARAVSRQSDPRSVIALVVLIIFFKAPRSVSLWGQVMPVNKYLGMGDGVHCNA